MIKYETEWRRFEIKAGDVYPVEINVGDWYADGILEVLDVTPNDLDDVFNLGEIVGQLAQKTTRLGKPVEYGSYVSGVLSDADGLSLTDRVTGLHFQPRGAAGVISVAFLDELPIGQWQQPGDMTLPEVARVAREHVENYERWRKQERQRQRGQ